MLDISDVVDLIQKLEDSVESRAERIAELESKLSQEGGYKIVLEASKLVQELQKERIAELRFLCDKQEIENE